MAGILRFATNSGSGSKTGRFHPVLRNAALKPDAAPDDIVRMYDEL
ncbi:hypothetical protein [Methanoregula sp. PtaB.Bin085]|nr:hypothetical protein [Methanoregula sp. PtaB.Bin085]OPX64545.1 MAG: hypothetical protein A4E33_00847 [Methanoregula sp. PtaB.Bin085]